MKHFLKNTLAIFTGMALVLAFQYVPFQEIFPAQAQTTRILEGPNAYPFKSTYLTPSSNTAASTLPDYALPAVNYFSFIANGSSSYYLPLSVDVNADGLLDSIYSKIVQDYNGTVNQADQYVLLNTGNGYNLVYICRKDDSLNPIYKGDCAAS